MHRLATTDELTGLANQRGLLEVARELEATGARPGPVDLAVVYVDVDGLKSVNDAHGHAAGDALIRSVADVLRARLPAAQDTIARVGGDEFAVLRQPELVRMRSGRQSARAPGGGRYLGEHRHRHRPTPRAPTIDLADLLERPTRRCTRPRWPGRTVMAELDLAGRVDHRVIGCMSVTQSSQLCRASRAESRDPTVLPSGSPA